MNVEHLVAADLRRRNVVMLPTPGGNQEPPHPGPLLPGRRGRRLARALRSFLLNVAVVTLVLSVSITSGADALAPKPTNTPPARATTFADLFGDPVIARGQGLEVKRSELEDAFTAWKANL